MATQASIFLISTNAVSKTRQARLLVLAILGLLFLVLPVGGCANQIFLSGGEQRYLRAEKALASGDLATYRRLAPQLAHHPLRPYLEFQRISRQLDHSDQIRAFLARYADSYLERRMYKRYIRWLGANRKWDEFLALYRNDSEESLRCYAIRARMAREGANQDVLDQAKKLWLKGASVDDACDPLFERIEKLGVLTPELRWQRIGLAMANNRLSLARYLAKKLPSRDQADFKRWIQMHRHPKATLAQATHWPNTPRNREIILHGLRRYSRDDTPAAWHWWHRDFKQKFDFSDPQIRDLENRLILRAAWRHLPDAYEWFQIMPDELLNDEAREWRVRTAMRAGDWTQTLAYIGMLPEKSQQSEQWQYWRARALGELGHKTQAAKLYQTLASNTSYYGFLAADRIGAEYTFTNEPVIDEAAYQKVKSLENTPAFQRIRALYDLGREAAAYSEWRFEIDKMSTAQKRVAARLAHDWGWHFTAIVTTAQANHYADLDLRFPLLYLDDIMREAGKHSVRPALVYGVIRRESAFKPTAVSPDGAMGLMQVMPATARMLTRKLGLKRVKRSALKDPELNIRLGVTYLRQVLDEYDGNEILATASYNAGPRRVRQWLPESGELPADIWVDSITFDETRNYVKAVNFYSTIFDWRTDGHVDVRLLERMKPVAPEKTTVDTLASLPVH